MSGMMEKMEAIRHRRLRWLDDDDDNDTWADTDELVVQPINDKDDVPQDQDQMEFVTY